MNLLALETTERIGGIALMQGGEVRAAESLPPHQRSAQSLAPAVGQLLTQCSCPPDQLDVIAVTIGPGSFTGLRVGVATAKALAYATGADVLGVDTLEVIAAGQDTVAAAKGERFWVAVDAQRGDAVVRPFQIAAAGETLGGWPRPLADAQMVPLAGWMADLPAGSVVTGPVFLKRRVTVPSHVTLMPEPTRRATATALARLAHRDYTAGRRDDPWTLAPVYARPSAAEEKRPRPLT
jgi:tRNA threonylcarbamoyladenosine biosynthesis protein TsaB